MQNDIISFEFSNGPGTEVLLDPNIVPQCSDSIKAIIEALVKLLDIGPHEVTLRLAAVERGSIIIGFKVSLKNLLSSNKDVIGAIADSMTIAQTLTTSLAFVLISTGAVSSCSSDKAQPPRADIEINLTMSALNNKDAMDGVDRLVTAVAKSGATQVRISIPDAPTCAFEPDRSKDTSLVGSSPRNPITTSGPFAGALTLTDEAFGIFDREGHAKSLHIGEIEVDGQVRRVLVHWRSSRPIPLPNVSLNTRTIVTVKGILEPWRQDTDSNPLHRRPFSLTNNQIVSHNFRSIDGYLTVERQVFEE